MHDGICMQIPELQKEDYKVSDYSGGSGWWQASDGKWYPPQSPETSNPSQQTPGQPYNPGQQSGFNQQPFQQPSYGNPVSPVGGQGPGQVKKNRLAPILIAVIVLIILIGGAVLLLNKNSGPGSPVPTAQTFWNGFKNNNQSQACGVVVPQYQNYCHKELVKIETVLSKNVKLNMVAGDDFVDGSQAIVVFTGKICISAPGFNQCFSNSNPKKGLPSNNSGFQSAWKSLNSSSTNAQFFEVPCVLISGKWYVNLTPNSGSGNSGSNSGNSGNSGTNSGTSSSTNSNSGTTSNSGNNSGTSSSTNSNSGTTSNSGTNSGTTSNSGSNSGTTSNSGNNSGSGNTGATSGPTTT